MVINDAVFWNAIRNYQTQGTPIDSRIIEWAKTMPDKIVNLAATLNTRFIEQEPQIVHAIDYRADQINYFHSVIGYCNHVLHGRWPELEDHLLNSNSYNCIGRIIQYAFQVIKNRWPEAEKRFQNPKDFVEYCRYVLRKRWVEKENIILKDPLATYEYCFYVIGKSERWKEGEETLIKLDYPDKDSCLCNYAQYIICGRWEEAEEYMKKTPQSALNYAYRVINGRWKDGEESIAKDPACSLNYSMNVLKGAFPLAEKKLLSSNLYFDYFSFSTSATRELVEKLANQFDSNMTVAQILQKVNDGRSKEFEDKLLNSTHSQRKAVWYASNVLKSRWIEAEDLIKRSAKWSVVYAKDVIKGRWEDAEKTILKDPKYLAEYGVDVVKDQLPIFLHNILMAEKLKGSNDKKINKYFEMLEEKN